MEGRFADAEDGRAGRATRGLQPAVVEAGDDEGVGVGGLADFIEQARQRERLVEIAFDAGGPEFGIDRGHMRVRPCDGARGPSILRVIEAVVFGLMT